MNRQELTQVAPPVFGPTFSQGETWQRSVHSRVLRPHVSITSDQLTYDIYAGTAHRPAAPEHLRHHFQFFLPPSCNASNAFSTLSEPETWLGGNSLNVARNWPMIVMAGIMTHNFLPHHSP